MTRLFFVLTFFFLGLGNLYSQCLCSEIKFRLVLPNFISNNAQPNYLIKTLTPNFIKKNNELSFDNIKSSLNGDTVDFQCRTGGGIDTLSFVIKNITTKDEMIVTVVHMTYDNPYFIDLTTFTIGHFLFDWTMLNKCQKENLNTELVEFGNLKFYQLELVNKTDIYWPNGFVHNKIRPLDLKLFLKSD